MKIGFVTYDYYPTAGGVETRVYNLASQLAKRHTIIVYTKKMKGNTVPVNHAVKEIDYLSIRGLRGVSFTRKIRKQLALDDLDILNIEQLGLHSRAVYASDSERCYVTIHGQDFLRAPFPLKILYKRVISLPHVNIITISQYLKDLFRKEYPDYRKKLHTLPHGVDTSLFCPSRKKRIDHFIFVGRLISEKRPLECVAAFHNFVRMTGKTNATMTMIGKGPLLHRVEAYVRRCSLKKNIRMLGEMENRELPKYYSEAVASLCPPTSGMVILESLSCGTPVIAWNSDMAPEMVIPSCGFLVPNDDPISVAKRMGELSDSRFEESYSMMSLNARKHAEKYAWPIVTNKLEKIYMSD